MLTTVNKEGISAILGAHALSFKLDTANMRPLSRLKGNSK